MTPDPPPPLARSGVTARAMWALDAGGVHLNHGSWGAVPAATTEYQISLIRRMNAAPGRWFAELPERVGAVRGAVADFLGAEADRTALVPNASAGVTVVLQAVALVPDAEIVLTDHAYGAVRMAAERAARRVGARVSVVPIDLDAPDEVVVAEIAAATTERTALVIVDHVSSATARVFPIGDLARRLHTQGIPLLVDAAHAPGMLVAPAHDTAVDYWVGNLHKWACAPRGTAALVASPRVSEALYPVIDSWGAPHPYPARFDTQGTIDVTSYLAAPHALRLIDDELGWDRVRAYAADLAAHAQATIAAALEAHTGRPALPEVGAPAPLMRLVELPTGLVAGPDDAHVVSAALARLGFETAVTSWRDRGFLRVSAHVYNTPDDYAQFVRRGVPALAAMDAARRTRAESLADAVAAALAGTASS